MRVVTLLEIYSKLWKFLCQKSKKYMVNCDEVIKRLQDLIKQNLVAINNDSNNNNNNTL